jgi:hypothetical protein
MAVGTDRQYINNIDNNLNELYNPYNSFIRSEYSADFFRNYEGFGGIGGGGVSISNDVVVTPISVPIPITSVPKVILKVIGLDDSAINYGGKFYYDNTNIEISALTTLDSVVLKPEYGESEEYYMISYEDVVEAVVVKDVQPVSDVITIRSGGGGGGGSIIREYDTLDRQNLGDGGMGRERMEFQ